MATKDQVISLHKRHPQWNSIQIAKVLDCDSAYVRATFKRNKLALPCRPRSHLNIIRDLGQACVDYGITLADINKLARRTER